MEGNVPPYNIDFWSSKTLNACNCKYKIVVQDLRVSGRPHVCNFLFTKYISLVLCIRTFTMYHLSQGHVPNFRSSLVTIWSKVSGHLFETLIRISLWHTPQLWILTPGGPILCLMIARTLSGRLSTRCLNVSGGMAAHSSCRAVARALSDVGRWGVERSWSQMFCGIQIRTLGWQVHV
jgi:hypothetical protein